MKHPIVIAALALGGLAYAATKAHASPLSGKRRNVLGKSGHMWWTVALPPDDMNTIQSAVFADEKGDTMVLSYRQVTGPTAGAKIGDRLLTYQAPTALAKTAIADFGPFINQGK
jgi:hypothetical protein